MKNIVAILAIGLFTAVRAQEQCSSIAAKIPSCATKCIDDAASSVGCANPKDLTCLCKNTNAINAAALSCVLSSCGAQQGLQVQSAAADVCKCVATAGPATAASSPPTSNAASAVVSTGTSAAPSSTKTGGDSIVTTTKVPVISSTVSASSGFYPVKQASDGQVQAGTGATVITAATSTPQPSVATFVGSGTIVQIPAGGIMLAFMAIAIAL